MQCFTCSEKGGREPSSFQRHEKPLTGDNVSPTFWAVQHLRQNDQIRTGVKNWQDSDRSTYVEIYWIEQNDFLHGNGYQPKSVKSTIQAFSCHTGDFWEFHPFLFTKDSVENLKWCKKPDPSKGTRWAFHPKFPHLHIFCDESRFLSDALNIGLLFQQNWCFQGQISGSRRHRA